MSVEATSAVWRSGVKGEDKLVLLAIADHADPEGRNAWPTLDTLAVYASVSVRSVQRIVRRLSDAGLVIVERNAGGTIVARGDRRPNLYEIDLAALDGVTPAVTPYGVTRGDKTGVRGDRSAPRGDSPTPSPAETREERPSEHPSEQKKTPSSSRRGTRLPDDWRPPDDLIAEMRVECPDVDLIRENRKFADHWRAQPGARGVKLDWHATWRNWMRTAQERMPASRHPATSRRSTADQRLDDGRDLVAKYAQQEGLALTGGEQLAIGGTR